MISDEFVIFFCFILFLFRVVVILPSLHNYFKPCFDLHIIYFYAYPFYVNNRSFIYLFFRQFYRILYDIYVNITYHNHRLKGLDIFLYAWIVNCICVKKKLFIKNILWSIFYWLFFIKCRLKQIFTPDYQVGKAFWFIIM